MKGDWKQHKKLLAATMILVLMSGCLKRCGMFKSEGYDAREAMSSTVKIYTKVSGHRNIHFKM